MISKKNIWVLTLFSLILVLSVYYITMPNEFLASTTKDVKINKAIKTTKKKNATISALKIESNEEKDKKMKELQKILSDENKSKEEKNNAYEELKTLNILKGKETEIESKINETYKVESFVKISEDKVNVVIIKDKNDPKLASNIMKLVSDNFDENMFISIKFQK